MRENEKYLHWNSTFYKCSEAKITVPATNADELGINLIAANRAVIFDSHHFASQMIQNYMSNSSANFAFS